jgi:NAD(P)-dependent dehydrogenase (short-subunit alcohol dehydrogenase family)
LAARGFRPVLLARTNTVEKLAAELNGVGVIGDVSRADDIQRTVATALNEFGRIDCVVNNTGHAAKGALLQLTDEQWHAGLDLLLLNAVRIARAVTPAMKQQGKGAITNISSFAAVEPHVAFPISSAIRAALSSFTKMYADTYAETGIRMNNVLPGYVNSYPESAETVREIPLKRYAHTVEIARAVAFLSSDDASYITGQNLRVDGGLTRSS